MKEKPKPNIAHDELRRLLNYDPETGDFTWKIRPVNWIEIGDIAGTLTSCGCYVIGIKRARYKAHRLAWFYMTGEWPTGYIDHINHDRIDNRWENLRDTSSQENQRNSSLRVDNKSGHCGVYWHKTEKKWRASIRANGTTQYLGRFENINDAIAARKSAEKEHGYHANHGTPK